MTSLNAQMAPFVPTRAVWFVSNDPRRDTQGQFGPLLWKVRQDTGSLNTTTTITSLTGWSEKQFPSNLRGHEGEMGSVCVLCV